MDYCFLKRRMVIDVTQVVEVEVQLDHNLTIVMNVIMIVVKCVLSIVKKIKLILITILMI